MAHDSYKSASKFLSLILRHNPEKIGLKLDENGWAKIDDLIKLSNQNGKQFDKKLIENIVRTNDKKRFKISDDGMFIRANQGHSIEIDLALQPMVPPSVLYHGTATRFIDSIFAKGLIKGKRQHVHLSADIETASKVGIRHGKLAILVLDVVAMSQAGCQFYCSDNGVWLTDHVDVEYLTLLK